MESPQGISLVVEPSGNIRMVYDESIDLQQMGQVVIVRGSHVEPIPGGRWTADLSPVGGPLLGPFLFRSQAIKAEIAWLECHWLAGETIAETPSLRTKPLG